MKKKIILSGILTAITMVFCYGDMRSVTYTTTGTNDLTVAVETNSRYALLSMAVAFTNLSTVTGEVTLVHNRVGFSTRLKTISVSNLVVDSPVYFDAPYIIDGKQGDTLTYSSTNIALPTRIFLTISQ